MILFLMDNRNIYLDYAAATPLLPAVKAAMEPYWSLDFGNPSAIHSAGRSARAAVETARGRIAKLAGVRSDSVIFTGSGTESNNLAVMGYLNRLHSDGVDLAGTVVLTTKLEHPSLDKALKALQRQYGIHIEYLTVDEEGLISPTELSLKLSDKVVLVAFAYANSEIGIIQPVGKLARQIRLFNQKFGTRIKLHIDAAQAPWWLPYQMTTLGVDFLALDVGKCGGPKGAGVLLARDSSALAPIAYGGGQENGLRPGTESVPLIVGAAEALVLADRGRAERVAKVQAVRDSGLVIIQDLIPEAVLNGPVEENRLPNNINISLPGVDTEYAAIYLDMHGLMVSTKSACAGAGGGESAVVLEITQDPNRARSTIRLTLGPDSIVDELETLAKTLRQFLNMMRSV